MTNRKNGFWTFVFSLCPGAGEMYMGLYKQGISLMVLFWGLGIICGWAHLELLWFLEPVIWFYSFFHVHNLASLPDEEFYSIEDDYIFHLDAPSERGRNFYKNNRRILAYALILMGVVTTWQGILNLLYDYLPEILYRYIRHLSYDLPRLLIGIGIILLGAAMIRGKKKEIGEMEWEDEDGK